MHVCKKVSKLNRAINCSRYLILFLFSAPNFYLPNDSVTPVILVGPGTGIAPFRAFWQQRLSQVMNRKRVGKMWLFFGCRQRELDLYKEEKAEMLQKKVLDKVFLALSREPNIPKVSLILTF